MRVVLLVVALASGALPQSVAPRPFRMEEIKAPPGFEVAVFARVSGEPRLMTFGPNGVLYVAAWGAGEVVAVPAENKTVIVLRGLSGPHSLDFRGKDLFVAVDDAVLRFRDAVTDDLVIRGPAERLVSLPYGGQHSTRTAAFGPDRKLYVSAGSTCNFCVESDPRRAAVTRYEADGSGETVYARGLRNSVGFAWHPLAGELWAVENGGDGLGDNEPPEEINVLASGADYGWPDCIGQRRGVDWGARARPDRCGETKAPEFEMQAHSAPLGISFYTGSQFPASYLNDAFIGFHGSWNRAEPTGYKVVRVRASSGRAKEISDFLWGFLDSRTRTRSGRPVQPLAGPDGSLYVSDDATGNIYRVTYVGPRINPGGIVKVIPRVYELYGTNLVYDPNVFNLYANGLEAEILYKSPQQVNFRLPEGVTGQVTITVLNEKAIDEAVIPVE